MESKAVQRRLAAILAADVVGYSRLMHTDEVSTLTMLKSHRRELIDPMLPLIMAAWSRRQATESWSNLPVWSMLSGVR